MFIMKCFVEIDCPELDIIQKEVIQYLTDYTKLLTHKPDSPWNIIQNTLEFAQQCPNVFKFCRKHQLVPRDVSFVVSHDQTSGLPIHVGGWPLVVKMNFPIMNTQGNETRWYNISREIMSELPKVTNEFGHTVRDVSMFDVKDLEVMATCYMQKPVVFNSTVPHDVYIAPGSKLPRIVMALMFYQEKMLREEYLEVRGPYDVREEDLPVLS